LNTDIVKPWWQSKTMWGGVVALACGIAGFLGFAVPDDQVSVITDIVVAVSTVIGGILTLYGRTKANTKIGKPCDHNTD